MLRTDLGSGAFYASTLTLAVVWLVGGLLSGPLPLGWETHDGQRRRPILSALIAGAALAAVFVVGALVVKHIPPLSDRVENVLAYASEGSRRIFWVVRSFFSLWRGPRAAWGSALYIARPSWT